MYYLVHKAPAYTEGYQQLDTHAPWSPPHLSTANLSAHNEDYLDAMLPLQLSLNLAVCPVPLTHTPRAFLQYNGTSLPSRMLYPEPEDFVAGLALRSDGCGRYMTQGKHHHFGDFCVEGAALMHENQVIYQKAFLTQTTDVNITQDGPQKYYEIFPYAGFYDPTNKIENLCQHYAGLFEEHGSVKIRAQSAQEWEAEKYAIATPMSSLDQDILNGHVQIRLAHSGIDTLYRSKAYQPLEEGTCKILVHFSKTI